MLNSFVPNLVWLPVQISKLSDREGSYAQKILQSLSYAIYKKINMPNDISCVWGSMPFPEDFEVFDVDLTKINYFIVPDSWLKKRISGLIAEIDNIVTIDKIDTITRSKVKSRRYLPSLKQIPIEQRREMNEWLLTYQHWLRS